MADRCCLVTPASHVSLPFSICPLLLAFTYFCQAVRFPPLMNITLQKVLIHLKQDLTDLYGDRLLHLTLFGSQARGDAEPGSDIDVLVVLKPPVNPGEEIKRTGKVVADLSLHYDVVISCLFMDETHYQTRNGSLLRNIRKEGVLI